MTYATSIGRLALAVVLMANGTEAGLQARKESAIPTASFSTATLTLPGAWMRNAAAFLERFAVRHAGNGLRQAERRASRLDAARISWVSASNHLEESLATGGAHKALWEQNIRASWALFRTFWTTLTQSDDWSSLERMPDDADRPDFVYLRMHTPEGVSHWRLRFRLDPEAPVLRVDHLESERPKNHFAWQGEFRIGYDKLDPDAAFLDIGRHFDFVWQVREPKRRTLTLVHHRPASGPRDATMSNRNAFHALFLEPLKEHLDAMRAARTPVSLHRRLFARGRAALPLVLAALSALQTGHSSSPTPRALRHAA